MLVPFFNKPPVQGGSESTLSAEQFESRFACKYHNGVIVPSALQNAFNQQMKNYHPQASMNFFNGNIEKDVKTILTNPHPALAVVDLGSPVGYGVMAREAIPAYAVVGIYTGQVMQSSLLSETEKIYSLDYSEDWTICALRSSGIARFFPHLPTNYAQACEQLTQQLQNIDKWLEVSKFVNPKLDTAQLSQVFKHMPKQRDEITKSLVNGLLFQEARTEEYSSIQFASHCPPTLKQNIATANLVVIPVHVEGFWYLALMTNQAIQKHQILGLDYGKKYWSSKEKPVLLLKEGTLVNSQYYRYQSLNNSFGERLEKALQGLSLMATARTEFRDKKDYIADTQIWAKDEITYKKIFQLLQQLQFTEIETDQDLSTIIILNTNLEKTRSDLSVLLTTLEMMALQFQQQCKITQQKINAVAQQKSHIPYLDKLPSQGGTVQYLTREEYRTKFNCIYSEDIQLPDSLKSIMINHRPPLNDMDDYAALLAEVVYVITNPRKDIAIVNMGKTGYGLMALSEIQEGEVLFIYSGNVVERITTLSDPYVYGYSGTPICISAKKEGGLARFLQHLPADQEKNLTRIKNKLRQPEMLARVYRNQNPHKTEADCKKILQPYFSAGSEGIDLLVNALLKAQEQQMAKDTELKDITFTANHIKSQMATANVIPDLVIDPQGLCYIVMRSTCLIKKHEIIGSSYNLDNYWALSSEVPELFLKTGEALDKKYYQRKNNASELQQFRPAYLQQANPKPNLGINQQDKVFWDIPETLQIKDFANAQQWNKTGDFQRLMQELRQQPFIVQGYFGAQFYNKSFKVQEQLFRGRQVRFWPTDSLQEKFNQSQLCTVIVAGAREYTDEKTKTVKQTVFYYDLTDQGDAEKRPVYCINFISLVAQCQAQAKSALTQK